MGEMLGMHELQSLNQEVSEVSLKAENPDGQRV